jgi:plastocyanin
MFVLSAVTLGALAFSPNPWAESRGLTESRGLFTETHVIRLEANRFVPRETKVGVGDTVRFVNGQGGPHNVEFIADSMPVPARAILDSAMTGLKIRTLSGPLLIFPEQEYKVVMPPIPNGRYAFLCVPHAANMQGAVVVERR